MPDNALYRLIARTAPDGDILFETPTYDVNFSSHDGRASVSNAVVIPAETHISAMRDRAIHVEAAHGGRFHIWGLFRMSSGPIYNPADGSMRIDFVGVNE